MHTQYTEAKNRMPTAVNSCIDMFQRSNNDRFSKKKHYSRHHNATWKRATKEYLDKNSRNKNAADRFQIEHKEYGSGSKKYDENGWSVDYAPLIVDRCESC